jgi:two-component system, chemotaxis family, CheB/CheR fusion protein
MDAVPDPEPRPDAPTTVVGIGASAGGLAALSDLLSRLPDRSGLSFVVVVHLAPDQHSHLADLLQRHSMMPVVQVTDTVLPLEPDRVYVIPPGRNLSAIDTHLRLSDLEERRRDRQPIDHFFRTLADTYDGHSVGVVLTGTGSDGTAGLEAIKARGGLALVQDPGEAEYDGMPRNAIASGSVDLVLPIAGIADQLIHIVQTEALMPKSPDEVASEDVRSTLETILTRIKTVTGHDVSRYKESTIMRRIRRRMHLHHVADLDAYLDLLDREPEEVGLLFNDILITVTNFFRDAEVFDALAAHVVPELFESKDPNESIRVWSVGCATGQEAYSLAMLLREQADQVGRMLPQVQMFASDLHEVSLQRARDGVYPASIDVDVSPERLQRFFVREKDMYRVRQELRDMIVFAPHSLLKDPPFSHIDLIVCRNLLIYLDPDGQDAASSVFHYALNPGGLLVLGTSESVDRSDLFDTVDKQHRIFRRRNVPAPRAAVPPLTLSPTTAWRPSTAARRRQEEDVHAALHHQMLDLYAPPSILVDRDNRIVHSSPQAGRFLVHPGGPPTTDMLQLVPEALRLELRTTVHAARLEQAMTTSHGVAMTVAGSRRMVSVRATPAPDAEYVFVTFDEQPTEHAEDSSSDASSSRTDAGPDAVARLETELDLTRQRLQRIVEEYETGQEELRIGNEDLQSTNEELRSTMEELETSKEELQSMNEELATLNQENRHKVAELAMLSSDLQNLLTATDIATLFLDRQLRIVRFTPSVTTIFNVVHADRGRPLTDFTHRLRFDRLAEDAERVLERLIPIEHEIETSDGKWLLTRLLPYRSDEDRIEGVVITFVDITARIDAEERLRSSERRLRLALDASQLGTWSWSSTEGGQADQHAYRMLGADEGETDFLELLQSVLTPADRERFAELLASTSPTEMEALIRRADGSIAHLDVHAHRTEPGASPGDVEVIGTIRDVTDRVERAETLAQRSERLALLSNAAALLLRGTQPRSLVDRLFGDMSAVLDLEVYERFELDELGNPVRTSSVGIDFDAMDGRDSGAELCAAAVAAREVLVRNDIAAGSTAESEGLLRQGLNAYACFPLVVGAEVFGALAFGTRFPRRLDDDTVDVIRAVADYLSVAEQRLRSETELRRLNHELDEQVAEQTADLRRREMQLRDVTTSLAQAEQLERERIAAVLHDDLQQLLYGAQMRLGLLNDDLSDVGGATSEQLVELERYIDDSIALTRRLTVDLAPQALEGDDFGESVRWLADQMADMHELRVDVDLPDTVVIQDKDLRVVMYQVLRELLFNVVKHAQTDSASVAIEAGPDEITVTVSDDGCGFDTSAVIGNPAQDRHGLAHVRKRLELLDGELRVSSVPGDGTRVRVMCPQGMVRASDELVP